MQNLIVVLEGTIDWTVDRLGQGDPVITAIVLFAAVAAAHAGNHLTGFVMNRWSKRKI